MTTPNEQIDVDFEQLQTSCAGIRDDTDQALAPGISDAHVRIFRGLHIGERSESGEVEATQRALVYAMDRFWRNGLTHLDRAKRMTDLLDKILAEYKTADDFAKLDVDAVLRSMDEARLLQPSPPAPRPRGFVE